MEEIKEGVRIKDRYVLNKYIGSGSFGEVWLAHDELLDIDVAVKIYVSLDPRGISEFRSEYITTMGLSHPNLLTSSYFDVWEHRPYLVMKFCNNGSVTGIVGESNEKQVWQFIHDVASGLRYLHELDEPLIHQDIKPDNILMDEDGHFLITDFGISKKMRSTMRKQSRRAIGAGATAYMGPERFDSDPTPVKASDIWSLGASIYELATGDLPFNGMGGCMLKNGADIPNIGQEWSRQLNDVMRACLSKNPSDRPTARQLEEISHNVLHPQGGKIPPVPPVPPASSATTVSSVTPVPSVSPVPTVKDKIQIVESDDLTKAEKKKRTLWFIAIVAAVAIIGIIIMIGVSNRDTKTDDNYDTQTDADEPIFVWDKPAVEEEVPDTLEYSGYYDNYYEEPAYDSLEVVPVEEYEVVDPGYGYY